MTKFTPGNISIALVGFMGVTGLGFAVILPMLVGAIVDDLSMDRSMVGWITSINIFGIALGGLVSTLSIGKVRLLHLIWIGCIGLIIFDLISTFNSLSGLLLPIRFISGIFGGILYASSLAAFSGLSNAKNAFSIYIISYALVSAISLFFLPQFIAVDGVGYKAGFYVLILMAFISLAISSVIIPFESLVTTKRLDSLADLMRNKYILYTLLSYFLLQLGGGVMYSYAERIGMEAGQSLEFMGIMFACGAIAAAVGALLVIVAGDRLASSKIVIVAICFMVVTMIPLYYSEHAIFFAIGMILPGLAWSFLIPFYQEMQAKSDPFGRVVTLGTIVNMAGRATGPVFPALFLGGLAFENVLYLAIGAILLSMIFIYPVLTKKK